MMGELAELEAELFELRRATVRRFADAVARIRACALAGEPVPSEVEAEFQDARELIEAWEAVTPNDGGW
jgi:hypothetical protein